MSTPASRRGFLRSLTSLPLIGGGLTLIGQPTAVAVPVSDELRNRYLCWLANEFSEAVVERDVLDAERAVMRTVAAGGDNRPGYIEETRLRSRSSWQSFANGFSCEGLPVSHMPPSTRAALVLSAVGCNWPTSRA